jgi:hypothetical protein
MMRLRRVTFLVLFPVSVWSFSLDPSPAVAVKLERGSKTALFEQRGTPLNAKEEELLVQRLKPKWNDLKEKLKHMNTVEDAVSDFLVGFLSTQIKKEWLMRTSFSYCSRH